jgi:ribosome-associated protein
LHPKARVDGGSPAGTGTRQPVRAMPIQITPTLAIPDDELEVTAIRAQGAGGQNVNKVASAVHLRFDVNASKALPDAIKQRIVRVHDHRISDDGVIVIKSQEHRSQEKNKIAAYERLSELIKSALVTRKPRRPTKPTRAAREKRLDRKAKHSKLKRARGKPEY